VGWRKLSDIPELLPAGLDPTASEVEWDRERQLANLRWADERDGAERRLETLPGSSEPEERRRRDDRRRTPESPDVVELRRLHAESELMLRRKRDRLVGIAVGVAAIIAGSVVLCVLYCPESPVRVPALVTGPDCVAQPAPNVNWSGCKKSNAWLAGARLTNSRMENARLDHAQLNQADLGYARLANADLMGANLHQARLVATDLRGADLRDVDLVGADLSYADLRGARLEGALLDQARFDRAYWVDGRVCALGSVSKCN
jgi:hypothetical protein